MTDTAPLRRCLDELEAVQRGLGEIVKRTDPERAHDLVKGRRELTARLHAVMIAGDALLVDVGDGELKREFRQRFTTMRSAAANLQATWPAVRVRDEGGADYVAAVAAVRASDQACIAWTRVMLNKIEAGKRQGQS